jgi:hypothetical protein
MYIPCSLHSIELPYSLFYLLCLFKISIVLDVVAVKRAKSVRGVVLLQLEHLIHVLQGVVTQWLLAHCKQLLGH